MDTDGENSPRCGCNDSLPLEPQLGASADVPGLHTSGLSDPLAGVETLLNALRGIASCATQCECCAMHRRIAKRALEQFTAQGDLPA